MSCLLFLKRKNDLELKFFCFFFFSFFATAYAFHVYTQNFWMKKVKKNFCKQIAHRKFICLLVKFVVIYVNSFHHMGYDRFLSFMFSSFPDFCGFSLKCVESFVLGVTF